MRASENVQSSQEEDASAKPTTKFLGSRSRDEEQVTAAVRGKASVFAQHL